MTENGKLLTASTPSAVVIAGTDSSCIAANKGESLLPLPEEETDGEGVGQNTLSVISYASALNSSYVYVPYVLSLLFLPLLTPSSSPTIPGSSTSPPLGRTSPPPSPPSTNAPRSNHRRSHRRNLPHLPPRLLPILQPPPTSTPRRVPSNVLFRLILRLFPRDTRETADGRVLDYPTRYGRRVWKTSSSPGWRWGVLSSSAYDGRDGRWSRGAEDDGACGDFA